MKSLAHKLLRAEQLYIIKRSHVTNAGPKPCDTNDDEFKAINDDF